MAQGDRIKYDHISGLSHNITAEEEALAAFLAENEGDSSKVMVLKGFDSRAKKSKKRERKTMKVDKSGKIKIQVSVFSGPRRHLDLNLKTEEELLLEKKQEERDRLWAERRARQAERIASETED